MSDETRIRRGMILQHPSDQGQNQFPTSKNGSTLGLHHKKGQQMENDIWTWGRVVLEAHAGHQVNEESIALLPEPSMLVYKNSTQNKKPRSFNLFEAKIPKHFITLIPHRDQ